MVKSTRRYVHTILHHPTAIDFVLYHNIMIDLVLPILLTPKRDLKSHLYSHCHPVAAFGLTICSFLDICKVYNKIFLIHISIANHLKKGEKMKKRMVQLLIISVIVGAYVLPVLATGGGGP